MALRFVDPNRPPSRPTRAVVRFGRSRVGQLFAKNVAAKTDVWLGRVFGGRVSWSMFTIPSATLCTVGAKSGRPRRVQIAYFHEGLDVIVIASNFGGCRHPGWYYNLKAQAACTLGGDLFVAQEITDAAEYGRRFALAEHYYAGFADYRMRTAGIGRHIPMFRLSPQSGGKLSERRGR